jgi:hypothetical protein
VWLLVFVAKTAIMSNKPILMLTIAFANWVFGAGLWEAVA